MERAPSSSLPRAGELGLAAQESTASSPFDALVRYAFLSGLVQEEDVVDGNLKLSSASRRNLNLRLERRHKRSFFIKKPDLGGAAADTVAKEARFYQFCAREPAAAPVVARLPSFVSAGDSGRLLVLELVRDARSLWQAYRSHAAAQLPSTPARELGRALGALHSTLPGDADSSWLHPLELSRDVPGTLAFDQLHPGMLRTLSPARLDLCRCLQAEPALRDRLPTVRAGWRAEAVIHGDVRSENVLVVDAGGEEARIVLVDWELVQFGDPAWDLAGALEDHARFWLENMSQRPDLEAAERLATARWPLAEVQRAVRALCSGYALGLGSVEAATAPRLARAVVYSAARMILTAWENCRYLERMSSLAVLLVQLATNILTDPRRSATGLYGLEEGIGREAASLA